MMNLRLTYGCIILFLLLGVSKVEAQSLDTYLEHFYASRQTANIEKVYLNLDRDIFLEKDQMLFHGVTVNSFDHKISDLSIGLHIEILSLDGEILQSEKFRLEGGITHGLIDFNLSPGKYILVAYSDVMKDLSAAFFKGFIVLDKTGISPSEESDSIQLEGFPEGGKLIENMDCFLVIKASDVSGKGVPTQGEIFTQKGDVAGYFETNALGLTKIPFQPKPGESYFLRNNQSDSQKFPLPEIQEKGTTCKLVNIKSVEKIVFEIQSNELIPDDSLTVFIFNFQSPLVLNQYQLSESRLTVNVPYEILDNGVHQLQVHDQAGKLLAKRLFFIEDEKKSWEMVLDTSESGVELSFSDDLPATIPFGVLKFAYTDSDDSMYSLEDYLELRSVFFKDLYLPIRDLKDLQDKSEILDQKLITIGRSHLDLQSEIVNTVLSFDVGLSYTIQFKNERKSTPLANQRVEFFSEALPDFVGEGETDKDGIMEINHLNFTDSAVFHFSIPDKKVKDFEMEILSQQYCSRKEVMPLWISFPNSNKDLSGILYQQALVKIPNNTSIDYDLDEFTLEVDKRDYDERYKTSRMFGNQGGKRKRIDDSQSLHPHPLKLAEDMGVRLVSTSTGGYRTADGLAIYWDGMRLTPATLIDNYSARNVAEVEVFQGGPIMFYSKTEDIKNEIGSSKLFLKGYNHFHEFVPHQLLGVTVFHPLIKGQDNGLNLEIELDSVISITFEGMDENGGKYFVKERLK
ncbi:MAG: hypothetical protein EA341_03255 [Mongoliibacter sp.]|uniref:hypothetical protein n=1 Tax=Mongoliibacter sp. TaxID=2022438 RepID=UPI0012F3A4CD|nr:hypothetical protein [Mongoliibacter sp.]TVP52412.1 MAG: hypothetical protein EA341_03255 [Mongoliibacter sp.]